MTSLRAEAIGLTFPRQRYVVTAADARLSGGAVSPSLALACAFGELRELSDPRLASRPIRVFRDLVGGALELRPAGTPLRVGDVIETAGRVADAAVLAEGERFVVDTASLNQDGDLVCEARFTFVFPSTTRSDGRPAPVPPEDEEDGRVGGRRTVMGRFDFVRIVEDPGSTGTPEIDPFRAGVDQLLEVLGGDPTRLRRAKGNIVNVAPAGSDLVVHGRRDKKRSGVILFEVASHGGVVLVADGVAEISQ